MRRFYAVCVALIVLGAVGAGSVYLVKRGGLHRSCERVAYSAPPPLHNPVNVYNSTTQGKIRGTGELRYTPDNADGEAQVAALRPWNAGMNPVADPTRQRSSSVDFVIGDGFEGLYPTAKPLPGQVLPCVSATAPPAG
jgi:hypothetical protein